MLDSIVIAVVALGVGAVGGALGAWRAAGTQTRLLRRDHAALSALLDAETGPRAAVNNAGELIVANKAARRAWPAGPITALSEDLADEEVAREGLRRLEQAAIAGGAETLEIPLSPEPAKTEWARISVSSVTDGDPRAEPLRAWRLDDVSAARAIGDVLLRERDDMAEFLHCLPVGVFSADADGRVHYANDRLAEWLGVSVEDITASNATVLLGQKPAALDDGAWTGEARMSVPGGNPVAADVFQTTFDSAGEARSCTVVVRRDGAEDGLQSSAQGSRQARRFRRLMDGAPVGIALADADGVITDANPALTRMLGIDRDGLVDTPIIDLVAAADHDVFETHLGRVVDGAETGATMDTVLTAAEGHPTPMATLYIGPLGPAAENDGPAEGLVVHATDTTEHKNLEAQFAQAQKMQAMGQLAGGVAHDFNNLLTAMIGFADLLLQRHGPGDPSFADIMQIKQNANRAANLVRQLLAFSRKQPLLPKPLNPTDALTELSHLLRRLLGETVELRLVHGRDLGLVRVDPGQFDQVIINLAVNARDAMPGGGTLTVSTRAEALDQPTQRGVEVVPAGRYVAIAVEDTGTGIPPETAARIFEPFFSTKQGVAGAGTGLGLSTVYGIIRQTDGYIFVDSSPGVGTTFTILLPRHEPADQTDPNDADGDSSGASENEGIGAVGDGSADTAAIDHEGDRAPAPPDLPTDVTILLVEDEDAVRVFASRALRNKGYTVLEARTGEGALDVLEEHPDVDILITDMVMPGMDGATLARLIKVERPSIRIILISGYSEDMARGEVMDETGFVFLPKPFSLKKLAETVRSVLATN